MAKHRAGHRTDIWSLGVVLYEMLVSEKVFEGNSELSVLEQDMGDDSRVIRFLDHVRAHSGLEPLR